jgi:signal transduction histidine kinase/cytochrome b subunit of formate dehydrogenase
MTTTYEQPLHDPRAHERVVRFGLWRRTQHWLLAFVFLSLVATGLPQRYYDADASIWIINAVGGIDNARFLHRVLACMFIGESVVYVAEIGLTMLRRRFQPSMFVTFQDFRDAFNMLRYSLGLISERPQFDRYDYRQKFEYWGIVFGAIMMIATGATLWFPTYVTRLAPGQLVPAAKEMHSGEALLAFLVIVIWHFYDVALSPSVFPLDTGMITGTLSRERMHEEHPREYARLLRAEAAAQAAADTGGPPSATGTSDPLPDAHAHDKPWAGVVRRRLHLRLMILVAIGMAGVLVALTMSALLPIDRSINRTLDERRGLAQTTARQADYVVRGALQSLEEAPLGEGFNMGDADPAPERSALRRALANPAFSRVYLINTAGDIVMTEPPLDSLNGLSYVAFTPDARPVLNSQKPSVSGLASAPDGSSVISIVAPIANGGAATGLIAGDIALNSSELSAVVQPAALGQTGYAQIVDIRGNVLASTRADQVKGRSDHGGQIASLIEAGRATSGTCHECHGVAGQQQRNTEVMAFAPLETAPWAVLIRQSQTEALAPARTLRQRAIMFGVPAVMVALAFAWITARSVLRPIGVLNTAAGRIAGGDLSQPVPDLGKDEVGGLAKTFEAMRVRLQESQEGIQSLNRDLENRVRERTSELEASRDHLRDAADEKAALYEELSHKEAARGELLRKLITAQEEERRRIARELHDETGQVLTALVVGMDTAALAPDTDIAAIREKLGELRGVAVDALDDVHRLIRDLRPSVLDDLGLVTGLTWYAETRLQPAGVRAQVTVTGDERRLPAEVETALFRIGQEAISNIAWHAQASNVLVGLDFRNGNVTLEVEDDGVGFDVASVLESPDSRRGWGILGMRERASLLGGTLEITSSPDEGTKVRATVPVQRGEPDDAADSRPHR